MAAMLAAPFPAGKAVAEVPARAVEVMSCHDCGLVHRLAPMADRTTAYCSRCGAALQRRVHATVDRALGCYLGALILFQVANLYPIMTFTLEGRAQSATIAGGARALWEAGSWPTALAVLLAGTALPLLKILANLYVLLPLRLGWRPPGLALAFRWAERLGPWAMMEVYLLGLIVAYVKLDDTGSVGLGVALYAFGALVLAVLAADTNLDRRAVWALVAPQAGPELLQARPGTELVSCHACRQLARKPLEGRGGGAEPCPRCGAALHRRKPEGQARATALVLTAAILYLPANIYPVMTVTSLGQGEPDTIVSGIRRLLEEGMVPIALLVLFASVLVPLLKLLGLATLLVSVRRRSVWRPRDRTLLYRVIEGIGRWSMVDIFMIAILTSLVNMGNIALVEPEVGSVAFAAVVILTMLAAMSFDPRLIWDVIDERHGDGRALSA